MICLSVALALAPAQSFVQAVNDAARALDARPSGHVRISVRNAIGGRISTSTTTVKFVRPDRMLLRIEEPKSGGLDASDRSYLFAKRSVVAVDHRAAEYLTRKGLQNATLVENAEYVLGDLGEPFRCAVSGPQLRGTLLRFSDLGRWTVTRKGGETWAATGPAPDRVKAVFSFDTAKRLVRVEVVRGDSRSLWTYVHLPAGSQPALTVPSGARKVSQFTQRAEPPQFLDARSSAVFARAAKAYDALARISVEVETGDDVARLWMAGRSFREDSGVFRWSFSNGNATILDDARRRAYAGKASTADLLDALGNLGHPPSFLTRALLLRLNPVRLLFGRGFRLRHQGIMTIGSTPFDILDVTSPYWKGTAQFDGKSGLLTRLTVKSLDAKGAVVSTSITDFRYRSVGMPIEAGVFQIRAPRGYSSATIASALRPSP